MLILPAFFKRRGVLTTSSAQQVSFDPKILTVTYLPLVRHCMRRARNRFPDMPADTTLQGIATEALWRAALRYDPSRGASFKTYAYYRVMGSLLDARRRQYRSRDTLCAAQAKKVSDDALLYTKAGTKMAPPPDVHADRRRRVRTVLDLADRVLGTLTMDLVKGHVLEGRSLNALARTWKTSYRTVLRRYKQGLARLRVAWEAEACTK
jgi:RNA polymerase sigma factor (sigma-70 family)